MTIENIVSIGNTFFGTLGAGASFIGAPEEILSFQELDINIAGSPTNAPATFFYEFSPDKINWDVSVQANLLGPIIVPLTLRTVLGFFRIRYINGATPLSSLRITTLLHRTAATRLTRFLNQEITDIEPVIVTRAVITGKLQDGTFDYIKVDEDGAISSNQGSAGSEAWPVSGPLTDGQLRATAVPVSGTVTATGPLTDTQLRASAVPISAVSLPLPTSASQEHVTAGSPHAARLTDGSSFYKATTPSDTQPISAASLPLPTNAATQTTSASMLVQLQTLNSLVPAVYDYIGMVYTGPDLTEVKFRTGGAAGSIVSTLTMTYSSNILQSVTRT